MPNPHWLTPILGKTHRTSHLVLWCQTERVPRPKRADLMDMRLVEIVPSALNTVTSGVMVARGRSINPGDDIVRCVESGNLYAKRCTIWFPRGWLDMVLSGFTGLIDRGVWKWRYLSLDGSRVAGRGEINGRRVDVTSCSSWTGGAWDLWRGKLMCKGGSPVWRSHHVDRDQHLIGVSDDELCALATVHAVLDGCITMSVGDPKLSIGAQARQWWRAWAGPVVTKGGRAIARAGASGPVAPGTYVAPLPSRPDVAAAAERHACYGMVREQFVIGHVNGPVHVVDMRSAYLAAMVSAPQPIIYAREVTDISGTALVDALANHVGVGLVLLDTSDHPYPFRRAGKVGRAVGTFWTWLAGSELDEAAQLGHVREVYRAYLWSAMALHRADATPYLSIADGLKATGRAYLTPFWRGLYSSCVGGWAQWDRRWVDAPGASPFGPWSTWIAAAQHGGEITRWRAIGGRVQYRVDRGDAPGAIPIAYACVTSRARQMLDALAGYAVPDGTLAICADALWVTPDGAKRIEQRAAKVRGYHTKLRLETIYEDAWLDGQGHAVVQHGGKRFPLMTGVPTHAEVGPDGISRWVSTEPWASGAKGRRGRRVSQRTHGWNVGAFVNLCSHPLRRAVPWHMLRDGGIPEELLQPLSPAKTGGGNE